MIFCKSGFSRSRGESGNYYDSYSRSGKEKFSESVSGSSSDPPDLLRLIKVGLIVGVIVLLIISFLVLPVEMVK